MSVYRRHNGGITATNSSVFFQKLAIFHKEVPKIWGENLKKHSEEFFINNMVGAWAQSLKEEKVKWDFLKEAFKTSCFQTCSCLTNRLISFVFTGKFTRFF